MKPVVKLKSKEGKLYIPTLPILPDELLIKIAEEESVLKKPDSYPLVGKSNYKKRKPEQLKKALYEEGGILVNNGVTKRRISNVRRKLSHLNLK